MDARILVVMIIFTTNFRLCQGVRYDGYSMFRAVPINLDHLKFLQNLEKQKYIDMIFWKKPHKLYEEVQLIVNPNDTDAFIERCHHFQMNVKRIHRNVQEAFDAQSIANPYHSLRTKTFKWDHYHTLDDIYKWLADLTQEFPNLVNLKTIGRSAENREIYAMSIKRKKNRQPTVIIEAGVHGNEWISIEFVTYLIFNLINVNSESDKRLKTVTDLYKWYLVPVTNPDGFDYSHKVDRLWRKNRRFLNNNIFGVDLNRNFDYSFGKFGTSSNTADDTYCGPSPFSEPETKALSTFVTEKAKGLKFYFSFHSYGQKIIIPYADRILHLGNYGIMENYGKQAALKIYKLFGNKYSIGNTYDTLGKKASGTSASWVKKTYDVPYVFTIMLRDNGTFGFALPHEEILPACQEALTGLLEIMTASPRHFRADIYSEDSAVTLRTRHLLLGSVVILSLHI